MDLRWLPHFLTLIRLVASPVLAWLLLHARLQVALALVLVAGVTDWLDGFAARRLGMTGGIGVVLDPLADKTMLLTLFLALGVIGLIPPWLLLLVVARDIVIVVGVLLLRIFRNIRQFLPSPLGKVSTFFQIVFVLLALIHGSEPRNWLWFLRNLALFFTICFTILSGLDYVRRGIEMARR